MQVTDVELDARVTALEENGGGGVVNGKTKFYSVKNTTFDVSFQLKNCRQFQNVQLYQIKLRSYPEIGDGNFNGALCTFNSN